MNITIIGGSGFVGTRLAGRLLEAKHSVRIADKRKSAAFPDLWMRCDIRNGMDGNAEFPVSITDEASAPGAEDEARRLQPMHTLVEALSGSDVVINLAAEHRDDVTPRSLYDDVNVLGSRNVCEACSRLGIRRIVFASSVAVYGFAPPGTDEGGNIGYFNDYGRTKFLAEEEYRQWVKVNAANAVVIIRPSVIFGEDNRGNVYNLLRQIARGRFPMVGRGTNRKSMSYVENVAAFIQFCVEHGDGFPCEALFNYCDEPAYDMNHLVLDCCRTLGKPKKHLLHFPYWLVYLGGLAFDLLALITRRKFAVSAVRVKKFTQDTYFTSSRVGATGFVPPMPLAEGLQRTIEHEFKDKKPMKLNIMGGGIDV